MSDNEEFEEGNNHGPKRFVRVIRGAELSNPGLLGPRCPFVTALQVHELADTMTKLSEEEDFVQARCVGMDAASALAVESLEVKPGMGVLDLCCAPGMKLMAIADLMGKKGNLIGVDVSQNRLNTTAAVLKKYRVCLRDDAEVNDWNLSIWQADGRDFHPQSNRGVLTWSTLMNHIFIGGKELKIPRKRAGKALRRTLQLQAKDEMETTVFDSEFDRVLVDAECTTDGRAHVPSAEESAYKKRRWTGEDGAASTEEEAATERLQLELLSNGFKLLKRGGMLVYSTCSMAEGQNENVLAKFMEKEPSAKLVSPLSTFKVGEIPTFVVPSRTLGSLGWRLTPKASATSGLFIARLMKC